MKDIRKFKGLICECTDLEDKVDTIGLLQDYDVPIADSVIEDMYNEELPNLMVKADKVVLYKEVTEVTSKVFKANAFINKLINCPDEV
jgi:hypothetical protein